MRDHYEWHIITKKPLLRNSLTKDKSVEYKHKKFANTCY